MMQDSAPETVPFDSVSLSRNKASEANPTCRSQTLGERR